MQRPALLRAIYAELRASLGPEASGGDLIRFANLIVHMALDAADQDAADQREHVSRAFFTLPVDDAMLDGGWRILEHEGEVEALEEQGRDIAVLLRPILNRYLGPEWRHPELTRLP